MNLFRLIVPLAMAGTLSACGSEADPTGQVAATLDGEEITLTQVNGELAGYGNLDPSQRDAASRQALEQILGRSILANEARERGLDKTPAGAVQLEKAEELALIQLLRQQLREAVPPASDQEAQQFIADNRGMFAERFVTVVEQLVVPQVSADIINRMKPINTLSGIQALLDAESVVYRITMGTVDSVSVAPVVVKQIANMGVGEVYVLPEGKGARVNAIRSRQVYPIIGDDAVRLAKELVTEQRLSGQVSNAFSSLVEGKRSTVKYAKEFEPAPTPSGKASATAPE